MARMHRYWPIAGIAALAVLVRLASFLGRGDYIAFDEGWYLLLARSLAEGDGYRLAGLRHVALSPLFPLMTAATWSVLGDIVWSGRLVAALAAGLVTVPVWYLGRMLAGARTGLLAAALVAVMPALAPFVAPFWIGWDLWVGAEPLLHVLLYAGLALVVHARQRSSSFLFGAAGVCFALAYLARPEAAGVAAVVAFGVAGADIYRRRTRGILYALALSAGFLVTAAPYWIYLHDALGRFAITGRGVAQATQSAGAAPAASSASVESMLWGGSTSSYAQGLYSLDASGTRLADPYWGVPAPGAPALTASATPPARAGPADTAAAESGSAPPRIAHYVRALAFIIPVILWPFLLAGLITGRRRDAASEATVVAAVLATSIAIGHLIASDPRTQAFILPLAAIYAARGLRSAGTLLERRVRRPLGLRRRFAPALLAALVLLVLAGTIAQRLYLSLAIGSAHHVVGADNRRAAAVVERRVPVNAAVMSWHPAPALFAHRHWQVLPYASFEAVVRFAGATGTEFVLLSAYYPAPLPLETIDYRYLLLHVPPDAAAAAHWEVQVGAADGPVLTGSLRPATSVAGGEEQGSE